MAVPEAARPRGRKRDKRRSHHALAAARAQQVPAVRRAEAAAPRLPQIAAAIAAARSIQTDEE